MRRTLDDSEIHEYGTKLGTFTRVALLAVLCAMAVGFAAPADAAVTFGASVTNANGSLSTTLTWSAPGASGCTASGHPSWTGAKAASGSLDLPPITLSGTYALTLSCTTPGNATTTVFWTLPTTNTDGTALTNLKGIRVNYGTSPTALDQIKATDSATATSTVVGDLAPGTWYFVIRAYNTAGVDSAPTAPPATKTVTAAAVQNASVSLTVNPIPNNPTALRVD